MRSKLISGLFGSAALLAALALGSTTPAEGGGGPALRLKKTSVTDPMAGGVEAFSLLVPDGWRTEGGVLWRMEYSNLATGRFRAFDPAGAAAALEIFPATPYTWAEGGIAFFPPGSVYLGNVVQPPPRSAHDYVRDVLLPQHRSSAERLRIVSRERLSDVERALSQSGSNAAMGIETTVLAERVRVEYRERGRDLEEDVYCVLNVSTSSMMPGSVFWSPDRLYSFRAEKGALDGNAPLLQAMASSVKISLPWFAQYQQVLEMWRNREMQAIRDAGALSRRISQLNDEILAMYRQSWEERQASSDRVNREFGEYIRGVETYDDPSKSYPVELPSGYRNAWVSQSGEYVLSNDDGYNPNVGSTVNWSRMKTTP